MSFLLSSFRGGALLFLAAILILAAVSGCSDDDPVGTPVPVTDISGVVMNPEGRPAAGAMVYLGVAVFPGLSSNPSIIDSVMTDDSGQFVFDDLNPGNFQVYAGVWNGSGDDFDQVSPFSPPIAIRDKAAASNLKLALLAVKDEGEVAGTVFYEDGFRVVPAESAEIQVYRYLGAGTILEAEGLTNDEGQYELPGIQTGNCGVIAFKIISRDAPFPLFLRTQSEVHFCEGDDLLQVEDLVLHETMVEKPAVYIYPREPGVFTVELELGQGVRLTASEPDYGQGWSVFVDRAGRIDETWDYLFYEVGLRGAPRMGTGWCLAWSDLFQGLERITTDLGLNAAEREDFLVYWRERLPRREFYEIQPVLGSDLDPWVALDIEPAPETSLRFWLFFQGRDSRTEPMAPVIEPVLRVGTTMVEWGGAILP